ncbi:MAG: TIGR03016 family PEP-CTERM system-associated outer membrane protein [Rhodoferax sp.]|nr:TIGR03016 family PEP-CTERM system-associated outer membrane protein [Rhodoferax sp.]
MDMVMGTGMSSKNSLLFAMSVAVAAGAHAQESGAGAGVKRTVTLVPRVSVSETLTDNVRLSSTGKQSEQITEISPGIRLSIESARLKTFFDYSLSEVVYAQNSSPGRSQNALNTFGTFEAVDNWAFLDFSGSISQQAISAFGTQSIGSTSINSNKTEVSNYRLSPYLRGRVGSLANYEARLSRTLTQSDSAAGSGVATTDGSVKFSGGSGFRSLGWSADLSQQRVDYSAGRPTEVDQVNLGLSYALTSQLNVFASAGRESNNYTSIDKKAYDTSSVGLTWTPSEMTKLSASQSHRSFGDGFALSLEHRTARTVWRFSDSKDASATPSQAGIASLGTVYDLLYSQFASLQPNPVLRAQLVNTYLQANNISPTATVVTSSLTSAVSLQRRQDLSFVLLGVRDTVTFIATRNESTRLDTVSVGIDDFSSSSVVRQNGFNVNYAHRLTPDYSLGVLLSRQNTSGVLSTQDSRLQSLNVSVSGKVGKQSSATLSARRVVSSGITSSYGETAVTGNLNVQF